MVNLVFRAMKVAHTDDEIIPFVSFSLPFYSRAQGRKLL